MNVNTRLRELYPDSEELFDIVLMTNNHAQVGVRLINSINHYGMERKQRLRRPIQDCLKLLFNHTTYDVEYDDQHHIL